MAALDDSLLFVRVLIVVRRVVGGRTSDLPVRSHQNRTAQQHNPERGTDAAFRFAVDTVPATEGSQWHQARPGQEAVSLQGPVTVIVADGRRQG
ncbi:uncharacterized protein SPSK_10137 [Sporothrix schenckii 1099-18]|uniref:Uncharacterized protein n=1 Tax=Sporothrix schenckii 1099-18 TaxID=1397361 RepID=A0A0F2M6T3_SPOSC|nr:uncharacterized protein SPSK_10137 [Sporothrix schenckii 1099-18]KJR84505.1 hypothetical protein SPSK_10137 [Sporothrix schenckii 1099-18]